MVFRTFRLDGMLQASATSLTGVKPYPFRAIAQRIPPELGVLLSSLTGMSPVFSWNLICVRYLLVNSIHEALK